MSQITITLPDGSSRSTPADTPIRDFAAQTLPQSVVRKALAAVVDGQMVDLTQALTHDGSLRLVTPESPEALPLYRHSTAHLLAAAVTHLYPSAQCGIGPATDEGFFYDFVVPRPFVPEDLDAIEKKMRQFASEDLPYERQIWPREEAIRFFAGRGEPLKVQLIEEKTAGQSHVSCYVIKDRETFVDFCVGPHVPSTGRLKAFKLLNASNAYWKGDARNQPMQRIYGTAFFKEDELKAHLTRMEEAKKRDHRRVGKDIGLFWFHPWAPGAAFWLGKGTDLYHRLANYMRDVLFPAGYTEVKTPLIYNKALWETSGHWQHYRDNMFLIESEGETMSVKPMNCPGHFLLFASEVRSYRDLPLRFHEQTPLHRNEASGVLTGLTRVRQFSQDDAHCFVTQDQIGEEVARLLALVQRVYGDFGLPFAAKLGTRPAEFLGDAATWSLGRVLRAERGRRRLLWSEDRLRRHRRHRPQVAMRHDPARLHDAGAFRSEIHWRRQHRAPPGGHPSRDFRQLRAVHRHPHRALRRSLPLVARPGPGGRPAHRGSASAGRRTRAGCAERRRPAGGAGRAAGEDWL